MRKPSVTLSCPANAHSSPGERIVEFSFPDKRDSAGCPLGGLISLRTMNDGTPLVDVYRTDGAIRVLAPKEQPGPKPERRYLAVKLDAGNDRNGNPRRGWLIYLDAPESPILGWVEEGYSGDMELHRSILSAEQPDRSPTPRQCFDLRDSGRVRGVCSLKVPYSEIREARRTPFKLPAA